MPVLLGRPTHYVGGRRRTYILLWILFSFFLFFFFRPLISELAEQN